MNTHCIGRVTKDAQIVTRTIGEAQVPVTNFFIAVNDRKTKATTYVKVTLWREYAQKMTPYLKKGKRLSVEGTFTLETWMNRENQVIPSLHFSNPDILLLDDAQGKPEEAPEAAVEDEELPFGD